MTDKSDDRESEKAPTMRQLGALLRLWRTEAKIATQVEASRLLSGENSSVSQARIAQYENGKVDDPKGDVLAAMAKLYRGNYASYFELLVHIVVEKYLVCLSDEDRKDGETMFSLVLDMIDAKRAWGVPPFLWRQSLRSYREFIKCFVVLDLAGNAAWQREHKDLELFWVVAPKFMDLKSEELRESVLHNIKRGVRVVYFFDDGDQSTSGNFDRLKQSLIGELKRSGHKADERLIDSVKLDRSVMQWMTSDAAIANPHKANASGFQAIRVNGEPRFLLSMDQFEVQRLVGMITAYVKMKIPDQSEQQRVLSPVDRQERSDP